MATTTTSTPSGSACGLAVERRVITFTRDGGCELKPTSINTDLGQTPNSVRTTRFTLFTWLPKSLFVQFQRAANIFFLFVSILVCFDWSPTMWSSTLLPFLGVLLWTALKDMYEDIRRRRDDDAENLRPCLRYDASSKKYVKAAWKDVVVGDILLTLQDEAFPADVLLLRAVGGQAFISTVNLDGETNLKERRTPDLLSAATENKYLQDPSAQNDVVSKTPSVDMDTIQAIAVRSAGILAESGLECNLDPPKAGLTDLGGEVTYLHPTEAVSECLEAFKVVEPCLLNYENFAPRGCVLRNTKAVLCLAAYVGAHTKTRLNVASTGVKISNMQHYLNRAVTGLVLTLAAFCFYAAILSEIIQEDPDYNAAIRFLIYWIVLYQIVPISLYVCFEILKLTLGFMINFDSQMVDPRTGKAALARTADLVEELGQINFIFSDKTGTLTENEMVFARCCIAAEDMGDFRPLKEIAPSCTSSSMAKKVEPPGIAEVRQILAKPSPRRAEVRWFFLCLVTCHSAQVEQQDDGSVVFSGSSPDEVAFLDAARAVGITFRSRRRLPGQSGWELRVSGPAGEGEHVFTVLCEIPFTSERKRMTIVCEYKGELFCITKGADNVMGPLCDEPFDKTFLDNLTYYSKLGLRTLAIASKLVDRTFFDGWRQKLSLAVTANAEDRDERIAEVAAEMEHSLELSGISAIEDRLQDGVADAIVSIKAAGIRFWVLTGDKTETAVEIVRACRLFTDEMLLAFMTGAESAEHAMELMRDAQTKLQGNPNSGLILDGALVKYATASAEGPKLLYELAMASRACVCCRLSPRQKRNLVELVKMYNKMGITLAVGDGANDVSMIQGAHVGIGIRGKEGNQAVQASDVALSQFRFLVPLLLCHGRRAYRRVATFLCYYIYKHVVLAVGDMIWAHQFRFGGEIAYPEWLSSAYSVIFTSLPVLITVAFDEDLPDEVAISNPHIYCEGLDRTRFNATIFTMWVISGIWHGALSWLVPSLLVGSSDTKVVDGEDELVFDFWVGSVCSFSLVIMCVNLRLWTVAMNPQNWRVVGIIMLSFLAYAATLLVLSETSLGTWMQPQIGGVLAEIVSKPKYLALIFVTPIGLLIDFAVMQGDNYLRPSPLTLARWQLRKRQSEVT